MIKMKNRKNRFEGLTCYMCNAPATSDEHVPPKCIFPEKKDLPDEMDLRKNLFKVPSCVVHNAEKSGNDEYLLYILASSITSNKWGVNHFKKKVIRAITNNPSLMLRIRNNAIPILIKKNQSDDFEESAAYSLETDRINKSLDSLARALYFHHFKEKWLGIVEITQHFGRILKGENIQLKNSSLDVLEIAIHELFKNLPFHGQNPEVFTYQVKEDQGTVFKAMRISFYENTQVTLLFK